jgi:uncharacterized protein YecT (DUF1311 family)
MKGNSVRFLASSAGAFLIAAIWSIGSSAAAANNLTPAEVRAFDACAQAARLDEDAEVCSRRIIDACAARQIPPGSTLAMTECALASQRRWDAILNAEWQAFIRRQDVETAKKFREAQRLWITSRDADCSAVFQKFIDGTIRNPAHAGCLERHTRRRVLWFRELRFE